MRAKFVLNSAAHGRAARREIHIKIAQRHPLPLWPCHGHGEAAPIPNLYEIFTEVQQMVLNIDSIPNVGERAHARKITEKGGSVPSSANVDKGIHREDD
jgi:hypothetical protein